MVEYRKKPVVIDAWQWTGKTLADAKKFCVENSLPNFNIGSAKGMTGLVIPTPEGDNIAQSGDFIIRGVKDEYYPCKPDIFEMIYELI